ncbi:hypothetical protein EZH22_25005 [Xanthobacter dioxanivorans]|uniref:Uncharacterized protein n=1 Tax=Xanthobacter dioxanivorans TaxID=2528964 RepID=A0A974PN06_9HYPH|nr:hypothetical protein [Xanthobacter dioxanivorans]QRG06199.1 hypothetical protein EZH22_25005 [Xanthobacter dioxanivorans]
MRERVPPALKRFIWDIQSMVELAEGEREILFIGRDLMARLVADPGWLPAVFATAADAPFRQFQLYADAMERFCVAATVLAPGARLPVCQEPVWEIFGVLSGEIERQRFRVAPEGPLQAKDAPVILKAGAVDTFAPKSADALGTANTSTTAAAIAIHAYGGEIASLARPAFTAEGAAGAFTTTYANPPDAPAYDILSIQTEIVD